MIVVVYRAGRQKGKDLLVIYISLESPWWGTERKGLLARLRVRHFDTRCRKYRIVLT